MHHIVKVLVGRIADNVSLPVAERVNEKDVRFALNDRICSSIGILVPTVGGPNFGPGNCALDGLDFSRQLLACEVTAV